MGKSQSKLSPDQLADLQKNTYCKHHPDRISYALILLPSRQEGTTAMVLYPSLLTPSRTI